MDDETREQIKARLVAELRDAKHQLAGYEADPDDEGIRMEVNEGFADSAQATAERSEVLSKIQQLRTHHKELADALTRMEEGRYGLCERCGLEIGAERLEAIPTVRLCVNCKQAEVA